MPGSPDPQARLAAQPLHDGNSALAQPALPRLDAPAALGVVAAVLDSLGTGFCAFDDADRTVLWNQAFLRFFPEHDGCIHAGEPYAENLRRFYRVRLPPSELPRIEQFVAEGLARHRKQVHPFSFDHNGHRLTVASLPLPGGGRLRAWTGKPCAPASGLASGLAPLPDALFNMADGAAVLRAGQITAVNEEFMRLYDLRRSADAIGLTFAEVVRRAWQPHAFLGADATLAMLDHAMLDHAMLDHGCFNGAAYEVELPLGRWRRVIERQADDGATYASHADITALKGQQQALQDAYAKLERLSTTDHLTGLANRRRFEQGLAHEAQAAARAGQPLSLLLVDVDKFKDINDAFGHPGGDACLQRLAALIASAVRRHDLAARLGGDEFALVLPGARHADALALAEGVRAAVAGHGGMPPMTVSIGVATLDGVANDVDAARSLVPMADRALYAAKRRGRNAVSGPPRPA